MKQKHFIDSHKAATGLAVLALIAIYDRWQNDTAWVYLGLHGTYGLLWALKSRIFPDKAWDEPVNLLTGLLMWAGLTMYWIAPWIITSQDVQAPAWYLGLCTGLYTFGVFFHFTSDMQKHTALKLRPGHLVDDGMFAHSRNMNYFGELLIYLGFGLLAMHWLPILVLLAFVVLYWVPRMIQKDRSLSRYPTFQAYKERSKLFIPFLF
jgi:protein-S-isoprenylcysteine O-methyltransferase Ste14